MNFTNLKNLKITTKLTISASIFLLPLGIMLFSIISMSVASIDKDRRELNGIEVLRPAMSLMQVIPQYVRLSVDGTHGDLEYVIQNTEQLLSELKNKYELYYLHEHILVTPDSLLDNWRHLSGTSIRDTVLWAYRHMILDLHRLIVNVGDISGLITDSDIESAYLVAAAVHELPQAQERMILIGNLLRTIEDGAFTQRRRAELNRHLELLVYSDNARIQNRFNAAESLRIRNAETLDSFEILLKACFDRVAFFAETVDIAISNPETESDTLISLHESASHANNATFRLQNAALDRLEAIISARIETYRIHLFLSLIAAFLAMLTAFIIIFATTINIRKSTDVIGIVFNQLDKNDLSVKFDSLSSDELGMFLKALNGFLFKLKSAFSSINTNTSLVSTSMVELSSSAKEMTATANEQFASVSEIVSTMENNKELSAQAAEKTSEVADLAGQTQELSRRGASLRDVNENMMLDIRNQNAKIIDIIKNLAEMLLRIDESIKLIDTIADHTKLIAFNAALEASSSGEAGTRFSVVAGEIRRFADNVVESASEIKERISELQEESNNLLTEANNGSRIIDSGYNRMVEQKEVFEHIVEVSQNVAIRSQQISSFSKQQEFASSQVFTALKEISAGINQFVSATTITSATVEKLNNMSRELKETLAIYHITDRD
ncbi:MAG: methyl-accepting chemotaxis protein [Treponema sp.]|nr:methyl-accepting chemotaxis protein [Treponema sp.]